MAGPYVGRRPDQHHADQRHGRPVRAEAPRHRGHRDVRAVTCSTPRSGTTTSTSTGKRVAIIGTGASAIQVVPADPAAVGHLDVYQRSAPWVIPRATTRSPTAQKRRWRRFPALLRAVPRQDLLVPRGPRAGHHPVAAPERSRSNARPAEPGQGRQGPGTPRQAHAPLRRLLQAHPDLQRLLPRAGLAPTSRSSPTRSHGSRRPASSRPTAWSGRSTCSSSHRLPRDRPADPTPGARHERPQPGRGVVELRHDDVQVRRRSHGFPNFFSVLGANSGQGHTSVITYVEALTGYVRDAIRTMKRGGYAAVEPARRAGALERRHPAPHAAHGVGAGRLLLLVPRRARPQPHLLAARHPGVQEGGQGVRRGRLRRTGRRP